jgi:hypothetical protein
MSQLNDYKCFINAGIYNRDPIPVGDGHLTNVPFKSVYSRVISHCGL